jgi:hypothetical protein
VCHISSTNALDFEHVKTVTSTVNFVKRIVNLLQLKHLLEDTEAEYSDIYDDLWLCKADMFRNVNGFMNIMKLVRGIELSFCLLVDVTEYVEDLHLSFVKCFRTK